MRKGSNMIKKLITFVFAVILILALSPGDSYGQGYTGIISVDSVNVMPGDNFSVNINLTDNNIAFSGLTIPIRYSSSDIIVDSVSFVNSVIGEGIQKLTQINTVERLVEITFMTEVITPLPTYSGDGGILATIYMHTDFNAPEQEIDLDSINVLTEVGSGVKYWQRVVLTDNSGINTYLPEYKSGTVSVSLPTAVGDDNESGLPENFDLAQNYPNPFNPKTHIEFSLPKSGHVKLVVFNIIGQKVETLIESTLPAGIHQYEFDGQSHPSGIYFYRLEHESGSQTKKMVMIK